MVSSKWAGRGLTLKFPLCLWLGKQKTKFGVRVCDIQSAAQNKDDPEVLGSTEQKEGCPKVASFRCSLASTPIKESFCHDNRAAASDRKYHRHMIKSDIISPRAKREREGGRHTGWPRTSRQKWLPDFAHFSRMRDCKEEP